MMALIAAIRFGLTIWRRTRDDQFKRELVVRMRRRLADGHMSLNDWIDLGEDLGLK